MNIAAVRAGVAAAISAGGFNVYDTLASNIDPPAAVVHWPSNITYSSRDYAGTSEITLAVTLYASLGDEESGQRILDHATSWEPGALAYELDQALPARSGVVSSSNTRQEAVGDASVLAVDLNLTIYS